MHHSTICKLACPTEFVIDTDVTLTRGTASGSYFSIAAWGHSERGVIAFRERNEKKDEGKKEGERERESFGRTDERSGDSKI